MCGVQFEQNKNSIKAWLITASRLYSTEGDSYLQLEDVTGIVLGHSREK